MKEHIAERNPLHATSVGRVLVSNGISKDIKEHIQVRNPLHTTSVARGLESRGGGGGVKGAQTNTYQGETFYLQSMWQEF